MKTSLDNIIPGEISNDQFYFTLKKLAGRHDVRNILEIGSSSGTGSTQAFVQAISHRRDNEFVNLFCLELSMSRYNLLSETYREFDFVKTYNVSSVASNEFPSMLKTIYSILLNSHKIRQRKKFFRFRFFEVNIPLIIKLLSWRQQDLHYVRNSGKDFNGINLIKELNNISKFDLVLIDGSEFTGLAELKHIIGAKIIALDDILSFKCFEAYQILNSDLRYSLIEEDLTLRNGYAIFELL